MCKGSWIFRFRRMRNRKRLRDCRLATIYPVPANACLRLFGQAFFRQVNDSQMFPTPPTAVRLREMRTAATSPYTGEALAASCLRVVAHPEASPPRGSWRGTRLMRWKLIIRHSVTTRAVHLIRLFPGTSPRKKPQTCEASRLSKGEALAAACLRVVSCPTALLTEKENYAARPICPLPTNQKTQTVHHTVCVFAYVFRKSSADPCLICGRRRRRGNGLRRRRNCVRRNDRPNGRPFCRCRRRNYARRRRRCVRRSGGSRRKIRGCSSGGR